MAGGRLRFLVQLQFDRRDLLCVSLELGLGTLLSFQKTEITSRGAAVGPVLNGPNHFANLVPS